MPIYTDEAGATVIHLGREDVLVGTASVPGGRRDEIIFAPRGDLETPEQADGKDSRELGVVARLVIDNEDALGVLLWALRRIRDEQADESSTPGPEARVHEVKTFPEPFEAVVSGRKRHEVRVNDRDYREGDVIILREWIPDPHDAAIGRYTGDHAAFLIGHVTPGGAWGLPTDLCVFSLLGTPRPVPGRAREEGAGA